MAVLLVAVIYYMLYRTQFGRTIRATMQDRTAAMIVGINVNRVQMLTFGVGVAVTAVGGMVFGATGGGFDPNTGYDLISRLLAIIILGGMGSIVGAMLAAILDDHAGGGGGRPLVAELVGGGVLRRAGAGPGDPLQGVLGRKEARAQ